MQRGFCAFKRFKLGISGRHFTAREAGVAAQ